MKSSDWNRAWAFACLLVCGFALSCSSSKHTASTNTQPPPVSGLQFTAPLSSPTLDPGQNVTLTVSESATFTLQSGCGLGSPFGTFSGGATTAQGTTVSYTAPAPAPSGCPQTGATAEDVVIATGASQTATLVIFLAQPVHLTGQTSYNSCPSPGTVTPNGAATVGAFSSLNLTQTAPSGGVKPYSVQVLSGGLPNGLSLEWSSSGQLTLTGTPVTAGCNTFTIEVLDSTATVSCDPTAGPACAQLTVNVPVVPVALKVQVPDYPSAYNDANTGNGLPYPPIALVPSGGVPPYFWCQDPLGRGATLPSNVQLNSGNVLCPVLPGNSGANFGEISGIPGANVDFQGNGQGSFNSGAYPTQIQVFDSQSPYPASATVNLSGLTDLPTSSCSLATQAPPIAFASEGVNVAPDSYLQASVPFAFMLRGFDANGPVAIAGSVTPDGMGGITGGTLDVTRSTGHQQAAVQSGSSYVIGTTSYGPGYFSPLPPPTQADYSRGCMTLALADIATQAALPPITFDFTLGGCSNHYNSNGIVSTSIFACGPNQTSPGFYTTGHIIEFDDNTGQGTRASGILRAQSVSSFSGGLSGPYAFGLSGGDSSQKHYAVAGSFKSGGGSISALAGDITDGGACTSSSSCNVSATGGSGTLTADATYGSTNGRWTATLSPNSQLSFAEAVYIVSPNEALIASTDALSAGHAIVGGEAIATASTFTTTNFANGHIFYMSGLGSTGPDVNIGLLNLDGIGSVTGTIYEDQAATLGTTSVNAAYSIDSATGRAVFSAPVFGQNIGSHPFVAYVIPPSAGLTRSNCSTPANCITGFIVGTDSSAQSGVLEFQTGIVAPPPPFVNAFVTGNYDYGTAEAMVPISANLEGDVYAAPTSSSTTSGSLGANPVNNQPFIQDVSYGDTVTFCVTNTCYLLLGNQALTGSYSINANGTGTFGGGVVSVSNGSAIFYIDESPLNLYPTVIVAEQ
ncbi:MAG TPA: hypothetical protein VND65_16445 [Candidatus Binatia bacterium]|nr:hypothetical protein [Candidatus Binatia bacterium]